MLIVACLGLQLKAVPILKPLFCNSPEVMINGQVDENYVDYNNAKIRALQHIIDCPIWPGEPIGFMTHSEDRMQSATTTTLHALIAASAGVEAITIASTDEAYSRGPITIATKIDTLKTLKEMFRDTGMTSLKPTVRSERYAEDLVEGILKVVKEVCEKKDLAEALYAGLLGGPQEGAYPGRTGRNSVYERWK